MTVMVQGAPVTLQVIVLFVYVLGDAKALKAIKCAWNISVSGRAV